MQPPCHLPCRSFPPELTPLSRFPLAQISPLRVVLSPSPAGGQLQTCSDNSNQSSSLALAVTQDAERQAEEIHTQNAKLHA